MSHPRLRRITVRPLSVSNLHRRRGRDLLGHLLCHACPIPSSIVNATSSSHCPGTHATRCSLLTSGDLCAMRRAPARQRAPGSGRQVRRSMPHLPRRARSSLLSHSCEPMTRPRPTPGIPLCHIYTPLLRWLGFLAPTSTAPALIPSHNSNCPPCLPKRSRCPTVRILASLCLSIVLRQSLGAPEVRLGKSGLKVSKIILGCMSYGSKGWAEWVIEDQAEVNKHIKYASVHTITLCSAARART